MPSTVIYKSGYPSGIKPVQQSGSIAANGIASGRATFILEPNARPFQARQPLDSDVFTAFGRIRMSSLFVESVSYRKEAGLHYCDIEIIGTTATPAITKTSEWSVRSYNVAQTLIDGTTAFYSFDYYAETTTWSWVLAVGSTADVKLPTEAKFGKKFNIRGATTWSVFVPGPGNSLIGSRQQTVTFLTLPLYITTKSEETRGNLVYYSAKVEALYQQ
jgi:hypothetical protein